eukprot:scaffold230624_cov32-Tisochrysis_lutea.AAC.6
MKFTAPAPPSGTARNDGWSSPRAAASTAIGSQDGRLPVGSALSLKAARQGDASGTQLDSGPPVRTSSPSAVNILRTPSDASCKALTALADAPMHSSPSKNGLPHSKLKVVWPSG